MQLITNSGSLRRYVMMTTLHLLLYLPLSRLSIIPDQVAGIQLSIPIIARLSVVWWAE